VLAQRGGARRRANPTNWFGGIATFIVRGLELDPDGIGSSLAYIPKWGYFISPKRTLSGHGGMSEFRREFNRSVQHRS